MDDLISRQAVDEYISHLLSDYLYDEERERLEKFSAWLWDELPSVNPQKVGRWIHHGDYDAMECSVCGEGFHYELDANFCPSCGAKMDGGDDNG